MKKLFEFLMQHKITPNGWFTLWSFHKGIGYPNYVNTSIEITKLERENMLVASNTIMGTIYKPSPKGLMVIKECERMISQYKKTIDTTGWDEKIKEYNELFPKGKRTGSTVAYRSNPKELLKAFVWFFEEYSEYDWDDVMNATTMYVDVFEKNSDYNYMMNSRYFIKKSDVNKETHSKLADSIWNIKEGNDIDVNETGYHYFEN
jgi:hypothetical protein